MKSLFEFIQLKDIKKDIQKNKEYNEKNFDYNSLVNLLNDNDYELIDFKFEVDGKASLFIKFAKEKYDKYWTIRKTNTMQFIYIINKHLDKFIMVAFENEQFLHAWKIVFTTKMTELGLRYRNQLTTEFSDILKLFKN